MLTRRSVLFGAAAFALGGFSAIPAYANSSDLLNDILIGITDAVTRNYIREHWREGRWDGHYWWHSGNRYSMDEYRHFLSARARPTPRRPRSRSRVPRANRAAPNPRRFDPARARRPSRTDVLRTKAANLTVP